MNWVTGIAVYVCIWWVVVFAVLPWGVKPTIDPSPGFDRGAPENPRLARKAAITTLVATLLWLVFYLVAASDLITFREN
jgi:predicted secreted protein